MLSVGLPHGNPLFYLERFNLQQRWISESVIVGSSIELTLI